MFSKKPLVSKSDEARLIKAIQMAELKTSGEIRVHIEKTCTGDVIEACKKKFEELKTVSYTHLDVYKRQM